jgi:DNA-binding transcriptional MerR regulator
MLIGELVKITGMSNDGLRYYEEMGLIHSRPLKAGTRSYRDYDDTTLDRLGLIALGKRMHFSLRDIAAVLDRIVSNQTTAEERRGYILAQIEEVDAKIADLRDVKKQLLLFAERPEKEVVDAHLKEIGKYFE